MAEKAAAEKILSMADIDAGGDAEYKKVQGFKPGEVVVLGSITAGDFIEWQEAGEGEAKRTAGLRLIVRSIVDGIPGENGATGKRIANDEHIAVFRRKPLKFTERLLGEIVKLNGMNVKGQTTAAEDAAKKD